MTNYVKLQNGSDVRGIAMEGVPGEEVNLRANETFYLANSFAKWLSKKTNKDTKELIIAIGYDSRLSSPELKKGIFNGLLQCNTTPIDCGITSTPSTYMSTRFKEINADGAIMITASHLPYNKNGMKFFTLEGGLNKNDIREIITTIDESIPYIDEEVSVSSYPLVERYSKHIADFIRKGVNATHYEQPLLGMHIIVDAGNGAGGFFAKYVLEALGADTRGSQFLNPDGRFPNHIPNPEDEEAISSVIEATLSAKADLGIIFDTDVDRAAVIDANGNAINRNTLIALMSAITLEENPGSTIVTDSVTSDGLQTFIESLGGKHHRFKRGYKNVIDESIRLNEQGILSTLAIETSGHGAFRENYFLDDGAYIVTKILIKFARLRQEEKEISDLISTLIQPKDEVSLRAKIELSDFSDYGKKVLSDFEAYIRSKKEYHLVEPNYEGIRVNYDYEGIKGWLLIRMSLHDPVIPINIESTSVGGCQKAKEDLDVFLSKYEHLTY